MKKLLTGLFGIILTICFAGIANACDLEGLYDNYQAVYMPATQTWTTGGMAEDRIVLTKKTTEGSGNYSEYYYGNGELAIALKSNFEFITNGKLIGVDNAGLKYYEINYDNENKKFVETPLCEKGLQQLFPNTKIVKISEFTNNEYTVRKPFFKDKKILLINDTDKYFHKYTYKPENVQTSDIKGFIDLKKMGKVTFSLYGDKTNMLTIKVKHGNTCVCGIQCNCGDNCKCAKDCKCKNSECNCGEKCNCGKDCKCTAPKCNCSEECNCGEKCNCGKDCKCAAPKCNCSEECNCGEKCNCGKDCKCAAPKCNCSEECNCGADCNCGKDCKCNK